MADTQSNVYAQAYSRNIMQKAQQKYAKLLPYVYMKPNVTGKTFFQDQIGEWSMQTKGGRNVETPNNDPNLGRRRGTMVDYHDNRLLDRGDELRTLSDPRSAYTIAAASSLGRQIDDVILGNLLTTANYGETGSSSVTHSNVVTCTAGSLYLSNVASIKQQFDDDDVEEEDRVLVVTPAALSVALQEEKLSSADYAAVKALVNGQINSFMGFKWVMSTRVGEIDSSNLPSEIASADSLSCIAFHRYGLCMAMGSQPLVKTDQRADLSYSWQVYYELNVGAVRLEEKRVVSGNA